MLASSGICDSKCFYAVDHVVFGVRCGVIGGGYEILLSGKF